MEALYRGPPSVSCIRPCKRGLCRKGPGMSRHLPVRQEGARRPREWKEE
ncbi:hypothetical protein CLOM621_06227 [Clostridium sp. M62/1]|nr:hypothetical protein CLOM621_06227 [Clostridium sp. M62/1]